MGLAGGWPRTCPASGVVGGGKTVLKGGGGVCLIGTLEEKNCYKCSVILHRARRCKQRAPDVGKADVCVCGGGGRTGVGGGRDGGPSFWLRSQEGPPAPQFTPS